MRASLRILSLKQIDGFGAAFGAPIEVAEHLLTPGLNVLPSRTTSGNGQIGNLATTGSAIWRLLPALLW
jgi:hypothetical protein